MFDFILTYNFEIEASVISQGFSWESTTITVFQIWRRLFSMEW